MPGSEFMLAIVQSYYVNADVKHYLHCQFRTPNVDEPDRTAF